MTCSRGCCDSFGEHVRSLSLASSAIPNRRRATYLNNIAQAQDDKDLPAYKRLIDSGLEPRDTTGCAELEKKAETWADVEVPHLPKAVRDELVKEPSLREAVL